MLPSFGLCDMDNDANDGTSMYEIIDRRTSVGRPSKVEVEDAGMAGMAGMVVSVIVSMRF